MKKQTDVGERQRERERETNGRNGVKADATAPV